MSFRSSLIAALLLLGLGSWYYFYEFKGKARREKSAEEAKLVFPGLDAASIQELSLHGAGGDLVLKLGPEGWRITAPIQAPADPNSLGAVVEALKTMQRDDVIDESGEHAADYGLGEAPLGTARFVSASGTAKAVSFGIDNPTGQGAYARVQGDKAVILVSRYSKLNVLKDLKDLRDKKVWDFQPSQVESVVSTFGQGLRLSKNKEGKLGPGDPAKIDAWLQQLSSLRISGFIDEAGKNLGKYGLDAPSAKIELKLSGQKAPLALLRGKKDAKGTATYYRVEGKPLVFSLAEYAAVMLSKKPEELAPAKK